MTSAYSEKTSVLFFGSASCFGGEALSRRTVEGCRAQFAVNMNNL
jgi:hypothetical protein